MTKAKILSAKFDVTSPTVQYGNVHTVLEVGGENWEEIRDLGLSKISEVDAMVSPTPFVLKKAPKTVRAAVVRQEQLTSRLTGITLNYDPERHLYTDIEGNPYLSGSKFPDQFYDPFDKTAAVERIQAAYPDAKAKAEDILGMWEKNGNISTSFGNAVHHSLENYINYHKLGSAISGENPNKALSKNPFFKKIVESFVEKFGIDGVLSEEFVADNKGHCGRVDVVRVIDKDKKIIRIQDFKTDANLFEKKYQKKDSPFKKSLLNDKGREDATLLTYHRFQLSYYAYILQQFGYVVEGLDIYWLNPETMEWEEHKMEVIDLSKILDKE